MRTQRKAKVFSLSLFVIIMLIMGTALAPFTVYAQDETPEPPEPGAATVDSVITTPDPGLDDSVEPPDPAGEFSVGDGIMPDQPDPLTGYTGAEMSASSAAAAGFPGQASYDSGWMVINAGEALTLTHNLGGSVDDYVVDLRFSSVNDTVEEHGYNQLGYGGNQLISPPPAGYSENDSVGAYWRSLTTSTVKVYRMPQDKSYAAMIRLRIWVVTSEDYDSGWVDATPGTPNNLSISIPGGVVDNYLVYMEFKDTGLYIDPALSLNVHQRYYGGFSTDSTTMAGAYWRNLAADSITVYVRPGETRIDQVRVRIWNRPDPTYDSGWVSATAGYYVYLSHNIGGNPDDYFVYLESTDNATWGINQRCYGGCDLRDADGSYANTKQGSYWRNLTKNSIEVGRRSQDVFAAKVRIRIWNAWTPTRPDYDSGYRTSSAGNISVVNHALGGSEDDYLVDFSFYNSSWYTHQLYFGLKYFGSVPPAGYAENDAGGAYWRTLTNSMLVVYRAAQDTSTDQWRVRIWKMPKPDYDSGWQAITAGSSHTFDHGLIGDPGDFLVDVTFLDGDAAVGKNQCYLGGVVTDTNLYYGAHWHSFNTTSASHTLTVYRYPDDTRADQVRVRIWRVNTPDYESGYQAYTAGTSKTFTHDLGGDSGSILVDLTANQGSGDHKVFYGRVDIGTGSPFAGHVENDRVGFYWWSLTGSIIKASRLAQDTNATSMNVRIWKLPSATFIPFVSK